MKIGEYYWLGISIFCLGFWKITNDPIFQQIGAVTILLTALLFFPRLWIEHKRKKEGFNG